MRHLFILIALFVMLGVSAVLSAVNPIDRMQIKRQLSTYVSTFPFYNSNSLLIETKTFNYDTGNQDIINSITLHETEDIFIVEQGWETLWDYTATINYSATYSHLNGIYYYDYHSDMPPNAFLQVRDAAYRIIDEDCSFAQYSWIHRRFDQTSRLDSLQFQLTNADYGHSFYKYYKLLYTDGHTYADAMTGYTINNNTISDSTAYSLNYGTTLSAHPFPLYMHEVAYLGTYTPYGNQQNYLNSPVLNDLLFISAVLNPVYQVASYTNTSTGLVQSITYEQIPTGYHITIGDRELWFDNDGYFIRWYNTSWEYPYATEMTLEITWDTITANEDIVQPVNAFSIESYPNPFKTNLSIAVKGKDKTPSDISIYNIKGQLIRNWENVKSSELTWNGKDNNNSTVSSGIYIIKAKQGSAVSCRKVIKL